MVRLCSAPGQRFRRFRLLRPVPVSGAGINDIKLQMPCCRKMNRYTFQWKVLFFLWGNGLSCPLLYRKIMNFIQGRLADNLRRQRAILNLTQEELAARANLSPGFIASIEGCKKWPSAESIEKLARALDVDPGLFFDDPQAEGPMYTRAQVKRLFAATGNKFLDELDAEEAAENPGDSTSSLFVSPQDPRRRR